MTLRVYAFEICQFSSIIIYIINNVTLISVTLFSLKNLGDGGLMSQGRAAELPVTTDTNVPLMPAAVFPLFDHKRLQHYSLSFFFILLSQLS